jgi:hypothetical protein
MNGTWKWILPVIKYNTCGMLWFFNWSIFTYKARTYNNVRATTQFVQMTRNFTCLRGMCTLPDHLFSLPVSFERFVHFLNAMSHSRDIDTSCPPGLTPCFVREIESVPISRTKLGVRPGGQNVSTSLKRNWEWDLVIRMCPHLSNETGSETWWSGCVHISMWTHSDHLVSLPVSFERLEHFLITRSHSQFR